MGRKNGGRLKQLRKLADLTQQEAADRCGVHIRHYQRLEAGEIPSVRAAYFSALEQAAAQKRNGLQLVAEGRAPYKVTKRKRSA